MRGQAFVTFPAVDLAHHALVCFSKVSCFPGTRFLVLPGIQTEVYQLFALWI